MKTFEPSGLIDRLASVQWSDLRGIDPRNHEGENTMELIQRFVIEEQGAETVEYALVLGLVALAAIVGLTAAGSAINNWWSGLASYISGTLGT